VKLLVLETATEACSAALWIDGVVRERLEHAGQSHSRRLLPMVRELLDESGIGLGQCDAIGFGRGPGSFTGVRIATGVAQGLALGADLPLAPVSTLAALAQAEDAARVLAALDARMGQVYWACYVRGGDGCVDASSDEQVCDPGAVRPAGGNWLGVGSGFDAYGGQLRAAAGASLGRVNAGRWPRAGAMAVLVARMVRRGETVAPEFAVPTYVRDSVARRPGD